MGGPNPVAAAAAAAGQEAAGVVAPTGLPFRCHRRRCNVDMDHADAAWIDKHLKGHDYEEKKEREALQKRQAERAAEARAAGPSRNRNKNKDKGRTNMPANQRAAANANRGGAGKKANRGR